jgi:cytochrome c553
LQIFFAAAAATLLLFSEPACAAGDAARGRAKAEICLGCHGENGNSTTELTPSLAGQPETFTTLQLILMREGLRQVPVMQEVVRDLSDDDIADLATFFAQLPPLPSDAPPVAAKLTRGDELAQRLRCASCHLSDYAGREQMPRLAGQREDYLFHAMHEYRDNQRVGTDTSMSGVLYGLSDADLAALAHYLAQQR